MKVNREVLERIRSANASMSRNHEVGSRKGLPRRKSKVSASTSFMRVLSSNEHGSSNIRVIRIKWSRKIPIAMGIWEIIPTTGYVTVKGDRIAKLNELLKERAVLWYLRLELDYKSLRVSKEINNDLGFAEGRTSNLLKVTGKWFQKRPLRRD